MRDKIVVIAGTTASGKSKMALDLAKQFDGYIINGDSRQIYRELKVGTAQPTADSINNDESWVVNGISHYLFGFKSIQDEYNLYMYKNDVEKIIEKTEGTPFLTGGTGLYIDSVIFNYNIDSKTKGVPRNHLYLYIDVEKEELDTLIEKRIEQMFQNGLLEENEKLWRQFPGFNLKPLKSIGYQEFIGYFEGRDSIEKVKEQIFLHTRQYAKRQRTWFRRNRGMNRVKDIQQAKNLILEFLNS